MNTQTRPFNLADCRPFNLEHAKAGAPVVTRKGESIRIIEFSLKRECDSFTLLALKVGKNQYPIFYTNAGKYFERQGAGDSAHDLLMAPLAYIQDRPVHVGEILQYAASEQWWDFPVDTVWDRDTTRMTWRWPPKKIIQEIWQPRFQDKRYKYTGNGVFSTKEACDEASKRYSDFLESVKTDEYEIEV